MNHLCFRFGWLLALLLACAVEAKQAELVPDHYIVILSDPPVLEYRGGLMARLDADAALPVRPLAATAPDDGVRFQPSAPAVRDYVGHLDWQRKRLLGLAAGHLGRSLLPRHVYRHAVNGFSVRLSPAERTVLAALPGVAAVEPVVRYRLHTDNSPAWIGARRVWQDPGPTPVPNQGEGTVLGLIDSGINWDSPFFNDIPGGIPLSNPRGEFFGLCDDPQVNCNNKIIGVYDFTDEATSGKDINGHGSHVGSIAVGSPLQLSLDFGTGSPVNFSTSGIAPRASVISYKVCEEGVPDDPEDEGGCPNSALLAAIEQAIEDQVDAINYSIGSTGSNPPAPWQGFGQFNSDRRGLLNARAAGIVPISSAGNSGPGQGSVAAPANAPWVVAVANVSHDRIIGSRLESTSGGADALPLVRGAGLSGGTAIAPIVFAGDLGFPLCGSGAAELGANCQDNSGASNPFPPGTFNGEIVVCDRGTYGRVEKGRNLLDAGAGGMILVNGPADGRIVNADPHCLPAMHVTDTTGQSLKDWLQDGVDHQGRISPSGRQVGTEFGGIVHRSSSRGPAIGVADVMKPNIAAPGTDVFGAAAPDENSVAFLTGTSMASPHVAGAALLLRRAYPDWGVDAIVSALETTADFDRLITDSGASAQRIDAGSGAVQVDRATRVGLYLPVPQGDFLAADPQGGGDPGALNLAGIFSAGCAVRCQFQRRLRALEAGAWTVSTSGELALGVTPSSFNLAAGQEVDLSIEIEAGTVAVGQWGQASVVLEPSDAGLETQVLPVAALMTLGELPELLELEIEANQTRRSIELGNLGQLSELRVLSAGLRRPDAARFTLAQDVSNDNPFSGGAGVKSFFFEASDEALLLAAETPTSAAVDIDLYIGRDDNGNGRADEAEVRCQSISPTVVESCLIEQPQPGTWWVLVQNWQASADDAEDEVVVETVFIEAEDDPGFGVNAPGRHLGGVLEAQVFIDQPAIAQGEDWWSAIGVSSAPENGIDVGVVPVRVRRSGPNPVVATPLIPGQTRALVLAPGVAHDRLYFDVPPGTDRVAIEVEGSVELEARLARMEFAELAGHAPGTPPAPAATLISAGPAGDVLSLNWGAPGQPPEPGRYYLVVTHAGAQEALLNLTVSLEQAARIEPQFGLWSPQSRAIFQGIEWQRAGPSFLVWYSYDIDGLPVFYIAIDAVDPLSSVWQAEVLRVTGNNARQHTAVVGEVALTTLADDLVSFVWRLNGTQGSELMTPDAGLSCRSVDGEPTSYTGHWFHAAAPVGGTTVIVNAENLAYVRYYFDNLGVGRWVFVNPLDNSVGATGQVRDFRGFCPNCDAFPMSFETDSMAVGTYQLQFSAEDRGQETLSFTSAPPLNHPISLEVAVEKLSQRLPCQP